jgi:hypothetical protein
MFIKFINLTFIILSAISIVIVRSRFSADFNEFIQFRFNNINNDSLINANQTSSIIDLERLDMGDDGSFGGRDDDVVSINETNNNSSQKLYPVILVHGITNKAQRLSTIRHHFMHRGGYTNGDIYATTYGDGGKTIVFFVSMQCDYVKQVIVVDKIIQTNNSINTNYLIYKAKY